jgi:hypothetical protein
VTPTAIVAECEDVSLTARVHDPMATDVTLSVPFVTVPNVAMPAQPPIVYGPLKPGSVTLTACVSPMELNVKLPGVIDNGPVDVGGGETGV